jgi:flavin-dependent dehydrogenase
MTGAADAVVVGGGPIGLATAIGLARRGVETVVVEPRTAPIDKACGEGLMPPAVERLDALGAPVEGYPFHGITYVQGGTRAEARFRGGAGLGVRRLALHAALHAAALEAGVRIEPGRITRLEQDIGGVGIDGWRAGYVIGADGLHSRVRVLSGIGERPAPGRARFGIRDHVHVEPWSELVEVHWTNDAEAYVTPVAPDLVGIAFLTDRPRRFDDLLDRFPALASRVGGAARDGVRGSGPLHRVVPARVRGRVALVGDAAGYVDAITGEGISIGLACADAVADAVARDRLGDYERAYARITRRYRWGTSALMRARRSPWTSDRIVPAAARMPRAFSRIVNQLG